MVQFSKIVVKDDPDKPMQLFGEVYTGLSMDTDDDSMRVLQVEKSAHDFLRSGRLDKIDINHNLEESGCQVIESFMVRWPIPDFKMNSWVLGIEVYDPAQKDAVRKGDLNGFSFYSDDLKEITINDLPVTLVRKLAGTVEMSTEPSIEEHDHEAIVELDEDAIVVPTYTSMRLNHRHAVRRTTATEIEAGHAHRMIY